MGRPAKIQPVVTEKQIPHAQPIIRQQKVHHPGMVRVRYKPTGKIMLMTAKGGKDAVKNSPKNYEIL